MVAKSMLVAHCGARMVTRAELDHVEAPQPTRTWFPVRHSEVIDFSRSFRPEDGSWHTSESFTGPDLLVLAEVTRQAFLWIVAATQGQGRDVPF